MPTRRARFRRRVYARLPTWIKRHDFEVFASTLAILAGFPILLGRVEPQSPEQLLPRAIVLTWALVLVMGGVAVLVGIVVGSSRVFPERVFWMRIEALGLTALAYFCYLYFICVVAVSPSTGWTAGMIILAFGFVSHVREIAIQMELEEYRRSLGLEERR